MQAAVKACPDMAAHDRIRPCLTCRTCSVIAVVGADFDLTPAAEPLSLEAPVLAVEEVIASAAVQPVPSLSVSPLYRSRERTGRLRECRSKPDQTVGRRAERQEAATRLRAGERWKRRLPQVCW